MNNFSFFTTETDSQVQLAFVLIWFCLLPLLAGFRKRKGGKNQSASDRSLNYQSPTMMCVTSVFRAFVILRVKAFVVQLGLIFSMHSLILSLIHI